MSKKTTKQVTLEYQPSELSKRVQKLKRSALTACTSREKVPHMLFWSLFGSEISSLKAEKEKSRILQAFLLGPK